MARCEHPDGQVFRRNGLYSVRCPRYYEEFDPEPDPDTAWRFFETQRASHRIENQREIGSRSPARGSGGSSSKQTSPRSHGAGSPRRSAPPLRPSGMPWWWVMVGLAASETKGERPPAPQRTAPRGPRWDGSWRQHAEGVLGRFLRFVFVSSLVVVGLSVAASSC